MSVIHTLKTETHWRNKTVLTHSLLVRQSGYVGETVPVSGNS